MKKQLLTLLALATPSLAFAQASSGGFQNVGGIFGIILFLGISILIFLALRSIMLWYWKVETILKNQETTNILLKNNNDLLNEYIIYMKEQKHSKGNNQEI